MIYVMELCSCGAMGCLVEDRDTGRHFVKCDQLCGNQSNGFPTQTQSVDHWNNTMSVRAGKSDGSSADYYKLPDGATQLQDLISHRDMNAQIGEIQRAVYRYGMASHSDKLRDAKKIKFYIDAEIKRLEALK